MALPEIDLQQFADTDNGLMARSVVLNGAPRCERCQLPPRWCICAGLQSMASPLAVDVLMHHMESYRPSSTGHLIQRTVQGARQHVYRQERLLARSEVVRPDRELWVLHPLGEDLPAEVDPARVQVLLIDGSWKQALEMTRSVRSWGRCVSLPMQGASRYWLRAQQGSGQFSTIEALLFLLKALGLTSAHAQLEAQFELHVYAGLCARGRKADAVRYLANSPARAAFPELLAQLAEKRPLV
jgi:DTW domain-containing protein YfiP